MTLSLGQQAKMKIGGVTGRIIGRSDYLHGSPQVLFYYLDNNGAPRSDWCDENLVEGIEAVVSGE